MDTHPPSAPVADVGASLEASQRRRLKRLARVMSAALILAPGVLVAQPLKQALANIVIGFQKADVATEPEAVDEGRAFRRWASRHRQHLGAAGGGRAAFAVRSVPTDLAGHGLLMKLVDLQSSESAANGDAGLTLADLDQDGMSAATPHNLAVGDVSSGASAIGASARSGASGSAGFGFGGGGGGSAAALPTNNGTATNAAGQSQPTAGLVDTGPDSSSPGDASGRLSAAPEPAVWMSLILGLGLTGAVLRKGRNASQLR